MTRERAKELLPVIQAFAEGMCIEYKLTHHKNPAWVKAGDVCDFEFCDATSEYRIKPEPREFWMCHCDKKGWLVHSTPPGEHGRCNTCGELLHVREVLE